MRQIVLSSEMSAAELKTFKAEVAAAKKSKVRYRMDERHYDTLIEESAEVFTPKGKLLGILINGCVPAANLERAYPFLRMVDGDFTNRGTAIGLPMSPQQRLDGSFTKTQRVDTKDLERENVGLNDYFGFWDRLGQHIGTRTQVNIYRVMDLAPISAPPRSSMVQTIG
jgi:hypothetical protein